MAAKDRNRPSRGPKHVTQGALIKSMTVENIYSWTKAAYLHVRNKPGLIQKGFVTAGYIDERPSLFARNEEMDVEEAEDLNLNDLIPLSDTHEEHSSNEDEETVASDFDEEYLCFINVISYRILIVLIIN